MTLLSLDSVGECVRVELTFICTCAEHELPGRFMNLCSLGHDELNGN